MRRDVGLHGALEMCRFVNGAIIFVVAQYSERNCLNCLNGEQLIDKRLILKWNETQNQHGTLLHCKNMIAI